MLFNSLWPITRCLYDSLQSNYRRESYQVRKTPLLIDRTSSTFVNQFVKFYGCGLMCPKKKSDHIQTIRFEFQETERQALEMVAASMAARNVTESVNNLVTPFTTASVAGVAWSLSILGVVALSLSERAQKAVVEAGQGALWDAALGPVWGLVNSLSDDAISNKFESIMSNINDKYI